MIWKSKIITAYPGMFPGVLNQSIIGKALKEKKWSLEIIDLHEFGYDDRKSIDDSPFGGGPGMIIRPDVIEKALIKISDNVTKMPLIYMTPSGKPLNQKNLLKYSKNDGVVVLWGHFEGIDDRAIDNLGFERISIGDYVLTGGELAA